MRDHPKPIHQIDMFDIFTNGVNSVMSTLKVPFIVNNFNNILFMTNRVAIINANSMDSNNRKLGEGNHENFPGYSSNSSLITRLDDNNSPILLYISRGLSATNSELYANGSGLMQYSRIILYIQKDIGRKNLFNVDISGSII